MNGAVGIIDVAQLEMMTGGDTELAAEVGIFRSQADTWGLIDAAQPPETWADACHAIKGAARSVGAMALGDACEHAEKLGRSGAVGRVETGVALSTVKDRLGEAMEALAEIEHHLLVARAFPKTAI
ncbi:MAG: Hpt domain-containing protein [Hyphomonadaceae bacterium]